MCGSVGGHSAWRLAAGTAGPFLPIYSGLLVIGGTLPTKLLKSCPFVLIFKGLQQVTQGHPYFLMKAGVDLTLAPLSAQRDPPSVVDVQSLSRWGFSTGSKTTRLPQKKQISLVRTLKCQCFAMSLLTIFQLLLSASYTDLWLYAKLPPEGFASPPHLPPFLREIRMCKEEEKKVLGGEDWTVQEPSLSVPGRKHEFKKRAK